MCLLQRLVCFVALGIFCRLNDASAAALGVQCSNKNGEIAQTFNAAASFSPIITLPGGSPSIQGWCTAPNTQILSCTGFTPISIGLLGEVEVRVGADYRYAVTSSSLPLPRFEKVELYRFPGKRTFDLMR